MDVVVATSENFPGWLELAGEVEALFGPMVEDADFHQGLRSAIEEERAFCIREAPETPGSRLCGGIVILTWAREIAWFAVRKDCRGQGFGKALLAHAISRFEAGADICVQTFDSTVEEGRPARSLYRAFGFVDHKRCAPNSAGLPTVVMVRTKENE
ncbi:MAG: GNAT family N-acetyltransferase [Desulfobacterales bacterium]|nr:GNAT family N-acetyltransferase [Desulfobacterales bacterium]